MASSELQIILAGLFCLKIFVANIHSKPYCADYSASALEARMQKIQHWLHLFLALALLSCGEKSNDARPNTMNTAPASLGTDIAKLAAQFATDSAKTRLVLILSPT